MTKGCQYLCLWLNIYIYIVFLFLFLLFFRILQLIQSGILDNLIERHSPKAPLCSKVSGKASRASLVDTFGGVIILIIGLVISTITIVTECSISRRSSKMFIESTQKWFMTKSINRKNRLRSSKPSAFVWKISLHGTIGLLNRIVYLSWQINVLLVKKTEAKERFEKWGCTRVWWGCSGAWGTLSLGNPG